VIEVGIQDRFAFSADSLSVAIRNKGDGFLNYATGFNDSGSLVWKVVSPDEAMMVSSPTFNIPEDVARALMDRLILYFQGGSDTRTLRKDYEHERARRDHLEDTMCAIATGMGR
jgi:hypothetical protein